MPNCKSSAIDGIHRFWLNSFISLHQEIAYVLNKSVQTANIVEWTAVSGTVHIQRDPRNDNVGWNYRHSIC